MNDAEAEAPPEHHLPALQVRADPMLVVVSAAALYVLHETESVCVPLLVSMLFAYALEPFVGALGRLRIPRLAAVVIVYALLAGVLVLVTRSVRGQVTGFLDALPQTVARIEQAVEDGRRGHDGKPGLLERLRRTSAQEQRARARTAQTPAPPGVRRVSVQPPPFNVRSYLARGLRGALPLGVGAMVVTVLTFLLLVAGDLFKRKIVRLAGPHFEQRKITVEVMRAIDRQIERYLAARLLISVIVAVGTGLGLWLTGLDNPAVWGLIAGVLNVLPYAGPGLAIALITLAAFLQSRTIEPTLAAGGAALLVAFIEGNVLTPWLTSRTCELNTVAVCVAVLFWGWLWGIWGLLLAIPIMVAIKAAADCIEPLQAIGELLGP